MKTEFNWLWFVGGLIVIGGCVWASAYFEAQAFNRATGKNVTTLDALFLDLRVQSEPKDSNP